MSQKYFLSPDELSGFFKKELANPNSVFVFSTDVVMNSWIDWCITHPDESGIDAVPLERFMAWDKFKGEAVRAKEEGKASIPSILRKFFVRSLIAENAASPDQTPIFKKIINPDYRREAGSFTDWISKMLLSLKLWHDKITAAKNYTLDEEDTDYLELYKRYSDFLEKHELFEPSWIEPDFSSEGKNYIIFYPEILGDYADYINIFENCPEITIVSLPPLTSEETANEANQILCNKYSDSRKELRRTILEIRKLAKEVSWNEITLNVPDLETYRPYLERELTKYCVPFVIRAGYPLIKNTAGQVFAEIQKCYDSDFSYDSVRALILDEYIPWKEEFSEVRQNFIRAGNELRCICGFDEKTAEGIKHFDSWESALSLTSNENARELDFYRSLKADISAICKAGSFSAVHAAWIIFRDKYLSLGEFSENANAIIGRCITELNKLIEIEESYCTGENAALKITNHFDFYITELNSKTYTPQDKKTGVQVYPYKLTAGAAFNHQFVIDSNQNNLEIQYPRLGFLNAEKRRALGLDEDDKKFNASRAFIRLYASSNDGKTVYFSFAEESFAGFAICHNALKEVKTSNDELDKEDFILAEKNYMLGKSSAEENSTLKLSADQKKQINWWQFFNSPEDGTEEYQPGEILKEKIREVLIENREKNFEQKDGKIAITQNDMRNFFPCHRKWLFSNVINLKEDSLDTDLMGPFDMGTINHKILELFMQDYLKSQEPLPTAVEGTFENEDQIRARIKEYSQKTISCNTEDYSKCPLTQIMLTSQLDGIANHIMDFLHGFLQANIPPEKFNKSSKTQGYGGCMVKGVELKLSAQNPDADYNYYGTLDLLLTSATQNTDATGWTIIDYKNTKIPTAKSIMLDDEGKLGNFQMPMYISLIKKTKSTGEIDVARFYSIKGDSSSPAIDRYTDGKQEDDFKPVLDAFKEYSEKFAGDVYSGSLAPDPQQVDIYKDCISCSFKSVCRYNYEVSKRTMNARQEND
ncbi:MAG: PD-(D/E)XK nuclease family protein [Treponema sp.]|nr:PD-(D/E)XK nuclease family protein [Treponema sp.]